MENISFESISYVNLWIKNVNRWYKKYSLCNVNYDEQTSPKEDSFNLESISMQCSQQIKENSTFSSQNSENNKCTSLDVSFLEKNVCNNVHGNSSNNLNSKNYFKVDSNKYPLKNNRNCKIHGKQVCEKKNICLKCKKQVTYDPNKLDKSVVIKEEDNSDPDIMIVEEHLYFKQKTKNNENSNLTSKDISNEQNKSTYLPTKYIFICLLCANQNYFYLVFEKNEIEIETFCLKCYAKHKLVFHNHELSTIKLNISSNNFENHSNEKYSSSVQNENSQILKRIEISDNINKHDFIFKKPKQVNRSNKSTLNGTNLKNNDVKKTDVSDNQSNHSHEFCHQFSDKHNKAKSTGKPNSSVGSCCNNSQQQHGNEIFNNDPSEKSELECLETNLLKNYNKKYGKISSSLNNLEEKSNGNDNNMKKHMKRKYSSKLESNSILLPNIFAFKRRKIKDDFYTKNISNSDTINSHKSVKSVKNTNENLNKLTSTNSNEQFNKSDKNYQSYSDQTEQLQIDTNTNTKHNAIIIKEKIETLQPDVMQIKCCNSIQNIDKNLCKSKIDSNIDKKIQNDRENNIINFNSTIPQTQLQCTKNSHENCKSKDTSDICVDNELARNEKCEIDSICEEQNKTNIQNELQNTLKTQRNEEEINSSEKSCKTKLFKTDKNCNGIELTSDIKNNVEIKMVPSKEYKENTNKKLNVTKYDENNKQTKDLKSSSSSSDEALSLNLKLSSSETSDSDVLPLKTKKSLKQGSYKKKLRNYKKYTINDINVNYTSSNDEEINFSDASFVTSTSIESNCCYKKKLRNFHKEIKNSRKHSHSTKNTNNNKTRIEQVKNSVERKKKNTQDSLREVTDNRIILNKEPPQTVFKSSLNTYKLHINLREEENIEKNKEDERYTLENTFEESSPLLISKCLNESSSKSFNSVHLQTNAEKNKESKNDYNKENHKKVNKSHVSILNSENNIKSIDSSDQLQTIETRYTTINDPKKNDEVICNENVCEYNDKHSNNYPYTSVNNNDKLQSTLKKDKVKKTIERRAILEISLSNQTVCENPNKTTNDKNQNSDFKNESLCENYTSNQFEQQIQPIVQSSPEHHLLISLIEVHNLNNINDQIVLSKNLENKKNQNIQSLETELKNNTNKFQENNSSSIDSIVQNQVIKKSESLTNYNIKIRNIEELMDPNKLKKDNELIIHTHSPTENESQNYLSCNSQFHVISTQDTFHSLKLAVIKYKKVSLTQDISGIEHFNDDHPNPKDTYTNTNENVYNMPLSCSQQMNGTELSNYLIEQDLNGLSSTSELK